MAADVVADVLADPALQGRMFTCKMGYLFFYGANSCWRPYLGILLVSKGFATSTIGLLMSVGPLAVLFLNPVVAYYAETRRWQTPLMFACVSATWLLVSTMFVASDMAVVAGALLLAFVTNAPLAALYDEHTHAVIGRARKAAWGGLRLYGTYGWAVGAPAASLLIYRYGFWVLPPLMAVGFGVLLYCVRHTPVAKDASTHRMRDVADHVLAHPRILCFLGALLCMGAAQALVFTYLFIYLKQEFGAPEYLFGLCLLFTVVVEMPVFAKSKLIHARLSVRQLLATAMFTWAVRAAAYAMLPNAWCVLLIEPLHGITFGFMWLAGTHFFSGAFPPALANSAFSTLYMPVWGLGPAIGNVTGGWIYAAYGPRVLFGGASLLMFAAAVAFTLADRSIAERDDVFTHDTDAAVVAMATESPRHVELDDVLDCHEGVDVV
jgi:predicted MFS family arabinose efflux permease